MKALPQLSIWDSRRQENEIEKDKKNRVGPFKIPLKRAAARFLDCPNYDRCLSHAAYNMWAYFTCDGCFKTDGKRVEE